MPGVVYSFSLHGVACVTLPFVRTPAQNSAGNPPPDDCSGGYSFHANAQWASSFGVAAGDTLYFQYWQRDPAGSSPRSLSNGLSVTFAP